MRFNDLPELKDYVSDFYENLQNKKPAFFLDYDGTMTPIVPRPEDAKLTAETRQVLRDLSRLCFVAIVSGRDRKDVKDLVAIDELVYSGSHGFDTTGPDFSMQHEGGKRLLPDFDQAEKQLVENLSPVKGARVERKLFAIAVHYRAVADEEVEKVQALTDEIIKQYPGFKKAGGKKIIELKPAIDWDKGRAVKWLLENLGFDQNQVLPVYIGDDMTDEDAFRMLRETGGVGILVGDHGESTAAHYRLGHPVEVTQFLRDMIDFLKGQGAAS